MNDKKIIEEIKGATNDLKELCDKLDERDKEEYIAFLEEKILEYDKELQRIENEYDKLENTTNKLQKELIETRFNLNDAKTLLSKQQSQEI